MCFPGPFYVSALQGLWHLLKIEIQELEGLDFDIELTGFTAGEFDECEPINLDDNLGDDKEEGQTYNCPKCGFEFEV